MDAVLLGTALVIGGLLAVQASANLQLTKAVDTPYGAATLQLWVAAALLAALAALAGGFPPLTRIADAPLWYLLGGLASPLYITSGILLFHGWARSRLAGCSSWARCWPRSRWTSSAYSEYRGSP